MCWQQEITFQECEDLCSSSEECAGFSFQGRANELPAADDKVSCVTKRVPMYFYAIPVDLGRFHVHKLQNVLSMNV